MAQEFNLGFDMNEYINDCINRHQENHFKQRENIVMKYFNENTISDTINEYSVDRIPEKTFFQKMSDVLRHTNPVFFDYNSHNYATGVLTQMNRNKFILNNIPSAVRKLTLDKLLKSYLNVMNDKMDAKYIFQGYKGIKPFEVLKPILANKEFEINPITHKHDFLLNGREQTLSLEGNTVSVIDNWSGNVMSERTFNSPNVAALFYAQKFEDIHKIPSIDRKFPKTFNINIHMENEHSQIPALYEINSRYNSENKYCFAFDVNTRDRSFIQKLNYALLSEGSINNETFARIERHGGIENLTGFYDVNSGDIIFKANLKLPNNETREMVEDEVEITLPKKTKNAFIKNVSAKVQEIYGLDIKSIAQEYYPDYCNNTIETQTFETPMLQEER